jgi:hypothetical protein
MLLVLNRLDLTAHFDEGQLLTEHSDVSLLFKAELWHASDDAGLPLHFPEKAKERNGGTPFIARGCPHTFFIIY